MTKGGRTVTTWGAGWNSGETTVIRVPIVLKNQILDYARAVDAKLIIDDQLIPPKSGDFLKFTLELIDEYIELKRANYHPNQNSRELDVRTRAWDELRKFRKLVETEMGNS